MSSVFSTAKWSLSLLVSCMLLSPVAHAGSSETSADVLRIALPASAWLMTRYQGDSEGEMQFYKSFATTVLTSYALKSTIHKDRPDGSDDDAFPSGHSAMAFQGAAFIQRRYGNEYGLPAYVLAAWTAQSRVNSDKHDYTDVLAGALIGVASSYYFTEHSNLSVQPLFGKNGTGLAFNYSW